MAHAVEVDNDLPTLEKVSEIAEAIILRGDLRGMTDAARAKYLGVLCKTIGLNPLLNPIQLIDFKDQGGVQCYVTRRGTDQLRKLYGISIEVLSQAEKDNTYTVHVKARHEATGRVDEDMAVLELVDRNKRALTGQERWNAMMKCMSKAKRRVTLSICGLGFLSEDEALDTAASIRERSGSKVRKLVPLAAPSGPSAYEGQTPLEVIRAATTPSELEAAVGYLGSYSYASEQDRDEAQKEFLARQAELSRDV